MIGSIILSISIIIIGFVGMLIRTNVGNGSYTDGGLFIPSLLTTLGGSIHLLSNVF
jgi:hypothetical protein